MLPLQYIISWCWRLFLVSTISCSAQAQPPPELNGAHFQITALEENGFLDIITSATNDDDDDDDGTLQFSGYLIDVLESIAHENRANFTYDLLPPSGYGSLCSPRVSTGDTKNAYNEMYQTQYNCGASDVNDSPIANYTTDIYLGMYYVTPSRQLTNQFTIPFLPPTSGTLQMFGYATRIPNFEALVEQQAQGLQPAACAPAGSALIQYIQTAFPGLQVQGIFGGEYDIFQAFQDGTCQVYIVDGPVAAQFVLRLSRREECTVDGQLIGLIGQPMHFGLSHYAIGIRRDIPIEVERTLSYWLNVLMSCSPLATEGECPDGNLATFYDGQGGTGEECGYVLYPPEPISLGPGAIVGIVIGAVAIVVIFGVSWHFYKLSRQEKKYAKQSKAATAQTNREHELNEFIAHEIRNPLASAIAALSFVSAKACDPAVIPNTDNRESVNSDLAVVESSIQFVNDLLRNMLDIHRSADKRMKMDVMATDILRDIFEPVASILFMRGAKVDILTECPENLIVQTDRMRVKQIFLNLAANATKFVESGYIQLRAEVLNANLHLYVEDSGPGIPLDKRKLLFAKFQESLDRLNQGTGVGLCICKNLSELLGADLFLDESFDSGIAGCPGTRFTLRLNQTPTENEMMSVRGGIESPQEIPSGDTKVLPEALSVLFVDDDTILRKMFSRTIQRVAPTWKITEASNGETSLRLTENQTFDLIFMDEYMASVEKQLLGSETVRLLRARGVKSLICGLSANDKEEQFMDAGANAFLFKPFPCQPDALKKELLLRIFHD